MSIPYHGCALNITVHSYLDWLDFGLIACRRSVFDAQSIADYIVEDFHALREADAALARARTPGAPHAVGSAWERLRGIVTNHVELRLRRERFQRFDVGDH